MVGVIGPSNFPFSLPLMSAVYMSLAGNSVVLKPSEKTPRTNALIEMLVRESGLYATAMTIIHGGPEAADFLVCEGGVSKIVVFGRSQVGDALAQKCVQRRIPFVLELGGGTVAVVLSDADIHSAAAGIAFVEDGFTGQELAARLALIEQYQFIVRQDAPLGFPPRLAGKTVSRRRLTGSFAHDRPYQPL